jgi:hypothetical protein
MRRRDFITLLGGAAAWPLAARAQPGERMRRIGVLIGSAPDVNDDDVQARLAAFHDGLQRLGWIDGRNVRMEYRRGAGDANRIRISRRNWLLSRRTSSWPVAPQPWEHCNRRTALCRLCW